MSVDSTAQHESLTPAFISSSIQALDPRPAIRPLLMAAMLWGSYAMLQMMGGAAKLTVGGMTDTWLLYATIGSSVFALMGASARSLFPAVAFGAIPLFVAIFDSASAISVWPVSLGGACLFAGIFFLMRP